MNTEAQRQAILKNLDLDRSDRDWNQSVKNVLVILSTSRSGSSLVYQALLSAPNVIAPAGEQEPWLFLSQNKYPYNDSDKLETIANKELLLDLMRNDLLVREPSVAKAELWTLLRNRLQLRGEGSLTISQIETAVDNIASKSIDAEQWKTIQHLTSKIEKPLVEKAVKNGQFLAIENPPYIDQPLARRFKIDELQQATLVFKSPSDAYRPGFFEELFPNAKINYIHLTRGFAQTSNGLMDGWSKNPVDFISNNVGDLNIDGYNFPEIPNKYWCFDLFEGWQAYRSRTLFAVCLQQWMSAQRCILRDHPNAPRLQFEKFYTNREGFIETLEQLTGLNTSAFDWGELVMPTDRPTDFRWKKRSVLYNDILSHLTTEEYKELIQLQNALGYTMDSTTWH